MTWSSSDAFVASGRAATRTSQATPADWDWKELGRSGPGGREDPPTEADREARRALDLEAAYRKGLVEGQESARDQARRELASAVAAAMGALSEVRESREAWAARLHENLVALATGIARHIVEGELKQDPGIFEELVRTAVDAFSATQPLKIRLHPEDMRAITGVVSDGSVTSPITDERDVRWLPDEDVVPGGCVVEGPERIVDGRVDEALERIYWRLLDG